MIYTNMMPVTPVPAKPKVGFTIESLMKDSTCGSSSNNSSGTVAVANDRVSFSTSFNHGLAASAMSLVNPLTGFRGSDLGLSRELPPHHSLQMPHPLFPHHPAMATHAMTLPHPREQMPPFSWLLAQHGRFLRHRFPGECPS